MLAASVWACEEPAARFADKPPSEPLNVLVLEDNLSISPRIGQQTLDAIDPEVALRYNPTLDYWLGTATPRVDPKDAVYCVNYVVKRWRFVFNASVTCERELPAVALEVAGGKVGSQDQAESYVDSPAMGTPASSLATGTPTSSPTRSPRSARRCAFGLGSA